MAFSTSGCSKGSAPGASRVSGCTSNATVETVAEARLLDLEVLGQEVELLLERHFLHADASQREAQQVAEPRQHRVGGVDVAVHQRRDGVQRVEQEMRLQLPLQRLQLRLDQPRLELRWRAAPASCASRW